MNPLSHLRLAPSDTENRQPGLDLATMNQSINQSRIATAYINVIPSLYFSSRSSSLSAFPLTRHLFIAPKSAIHRKTPIMIKGKCACGRVQYHTQAEPLAANACHCEECRRQSGGPFLGFIGLPMSEVHWIQPPEIWASSDIAERGFCKVCGSAMSMRYLFDPHRIAVTMGTIIEASPAVPRPAHIFLKEKASWFVLPDDGAERHDDFPGDFRTKIDQWRKDRK